ncbi:MAG: hypothetical protein ACERKD_24130 [Prolixibacteraceae bacterium]
MKQKHLYRVFSLLLIFISLLEVGSAQNLVLQTNKKVYISGEELAYKCTLVQKGQELNKILFVDICGEGYTVTSQVIKSQNSYWSGQIVLPDTLQTGVYLLRSYVGSDNGQPTITSQPITVFNRFGNNAVNTQRKSMPGYSPLFDQNEEDTSSDSALGLTVNKNKFKPKDKITFSLNNKLEQNIGGLSFSVYKTSGQLNTTSPQGNDYPVFTPSKHIQIYSRLILHGALTQTKTQQVVPNETILLSIPDSIPNINYAYTNENGEFQFILDDFYGQQDLVVQTINKQLDLTIRLDPILLLPPAKIPYYIPEEIENGDFAKLAIQRATLHKIYGETPVIKEKTIENKLPFYGLSEQRIYPKKYVPLNDFKEIAWEILPTIKYKSEKDSTYLRIWNPNSKAFYFNPWTLVDGVPVYNHAGINVLNSEKISWIEIQPQVRCFGDLFIEGLLSIQTKNGNFSDVPLPKNSVRKNMMTLFDVNSQVNFDQPFFRDVLYWNATIELNNKNTNIEVDCSYEKGSYIAIVQTPDPSGRIHRTVVKFEVE